MTAEHAQHDPGWSPLDDEGDRAQIESLLDILGGASVRADGATGAKDVVDLGCGSGRATLPLARAGHRVIALDCDTAAIAACRRALEGDDARCGESIEFIQADMVEWLECARGRFDAAVCLGFTIMTILERADLERFFTAAASHLAADGFLAIDDVPFHCWGEIAAGNWQDGISEDGSMQLVWMPGEAIFALRSGEEVDADNASIRPGEQLHRAWSMRDLRDCAGCAGLEPDMSRLQSRLILFRRGGAASASRG